MPPRGGYAEPIGSAGRAFDGSGVPVPREPSSHRRAARLPTLRSQDGCQFALLPPHNWTILPLIWR